jgi:type I restriction enzyme, R subunit
MGQSHRRERPGGEATRTLVRDLNKAGICHPGGERDLAQRLVALAKENHENLTRS